MDYIYNQELNKNFSVFGSFYNLEMGSETIF